MAILVAGAGGFIGGQLVRTLESRGMAVRAVDRKPLDAWFYRSEDAENLVFDLKDRDACQFVTTGISDVYNLAADMGGMGFIENNKALCMLSVLINTNLLLASRDNDVQSIFLLVVCVCISCLSATGGRYRGASRKRRLPRNAGRRLRLGEAVQRTDVPPFPRGFWLANAQSGVITTSMGRTERGMAVGRRHLRPSRARSRWLLSPGKTTSKSGETVNRREASCISTIA